MATFANLANLGGIVATTSSSVNNNRLGVHFSVAHLRTIDLLLAVGARKGMGCAVHVGRTEFPKLDLPATFRKQNCFELRRWMKQLGVKYLGSIKLGIDRAIGGDHAFGAIMHLVGV
jgi:hypothetical protein